MLRSAIAHCSATLIGSLLMTRCCKIKLNPMIWSVGSVALIYFCVNSRGEHLMRSSPLGGRQVLVSLTYEPQDPRIRNANVRHCYGTHIPG